MGSTMQPSTLAIAQISPRLRVRLYWGVTAIFCLQMSFTAYAQLQLPQVAEAFTHLGFSAFKPCRRAWNGAIHPLFHSGRQNPCETGVEHNAS